MWGIESDRSPYSHNHTHPHSQPDSFVHRDSYCFINIFPHRYAHTTTL